MSISQRDANVIGNNAAYKLGLTLEFNPNEDSFIEDFEKKSAKERENFINSLPLNSLNREGCISVYDSGAIIGIRKAWRQLKKQINDKGRPEHKVIDSVLGVIHTGTYHSSQFVFDTRRLEISRISTNSKGKKPEVCIMKGENIMRKYCWGDAKVTNYQIYKGKTIPIVHA